VISNTAFRLGEFQKLKGLHVDETRLDFIMSILNDVCGPFESGSKDSDVEIDTNPKTPMISQIKDFFPDLGEGFIEACLVAFDNNPEKVINSILENNLPGAVAKMDRKLKQLPRVNTPKHSKADVESSSFVGSRKNIFDNDKFDIATVDEFESSKVYKKRAKEDASAMAKILDDKTDIALFKSKYEDYQYEDEYDDALDEFSNFQITNEETSDERNQKIVNVPVLEETVEEETESEPTETTTKREHEGGFLRGRGRGTSSRGKDQQKFKSHNRKEQSNKKRNAFFNK